MIVAGLGVGMLLPWRQSLELARLGESLGFDRVYCPENLMMRPAWTLLAILAENTSRVQLGPMVVNPYHSHPALIACYVAEVDEISGGRAILGIGRGDYHEYIGLKPERALTAIVETIEIVNRILAGDRSPYRGKIFTANPEASLRWKPVRSKVPIAVGSLGPRTWELAGRLADEVDTGFIVKADIFPMVKKHVAAGAREVGRDPGEVTIGFGSLCSISQDGDAARRMAKEKLASFLPRLTQIPEAFAPDPEEVERIRRETTVGGVKGAADYISEASLRSYALSGTPGEVIERLEELVDAGATALGFGLPLGPDPVEAVRLLGERVLPHVKRFHE